MTSLAISCSITLVGLPDIAKTALLLTSPVISGVGHELTVLRADTSETWSLNDQPATVTARQYRLILNGIVAVEPQSDPALTLPSGSGGQVYSYQMRAAVDSAGDIYSPWFEVATGNVVLATAAPEAFKLGDWALDAVQTAGAVEISVLTLPTNGGLAITDIEYSLNGGDFTSVGGDVVGTYRIAGLDLGKSYTLDLRAVNAVGAGARSDGKNVTIADVPAAFAPLDWSTEVLENKTDVRIVVTALPSSRGAPLTQLQYSIDGSDWVDYSTAPAVGTFDIADLLVEGVSSNVTIRASNAIGDGPASDTKTLTPTTDLSLTGMVNSEVEIDGASGTIMLTITEPASVASFDSGDGPGVFMVTITDLEAGPVCLVPALIAGGEDADVGTPLTVVPGLWIYDGNNTEPDLSYQWLRGGVAITGEAGMTYVLNEADEEQSVVVEESATDANGSRSSVSGPLTLGPPTNITAAQDSFDEADGYTLGDTVASSVLWDQVFASSNIEAVINPVGVAQLRLTQSATNQNIVLGFSGAVTDDHAVQVEFGGVGTGEGDREDFRLQVRVTNDGSSNIVDAIDVFFKYSTSQVFLREMNAGASINSIPTINEIRLEPGYVARLEVVGTTATLQLDTGTGMTTLGVLTGLTTTGGRPAFGAFLNHSNAFRSVNVRSIQVENM